MTAPSTRDDTTPAATTLDAASLARLRELDPDGRTGVVQRVMRTFDTSLTQALGALALAGERGDTIELRRLAHTLKSSSASVGALELASACDAVERRIKLGAAAQRHDVEILLEQGRAALSAVRTMLGP